MVSGRVREGAMTNHGTRLASVLAMAMIGAAGLAPQRAEAALIQVSSRAALGANLTVDWSVLVPPGRNSSPASAPRRSGR